jgi:hypothetical protein
MIGGFAPPTPAVVAGACRPRLSRKDKLPRLIWWRITATGVSRKPARSAQPGALVIPCTTRRRGMRDSWPEQSKICTIFVQSLPAAHGLPRAAQPATCARPRQSKVLPDSTFGFSHGCLANGGPAPYLMRYVACRRPSKDALSVCARGIEPCRPLWCRLRRLSPRRNSRRFHDWRG